ncbi:MAG TPA: crotonase/enoyl-CoA hydratase family protein [Candidatus Baltobacteraceae bacterium]|nr:crotonase/enoyl-CoA hydratase family protein [Candidatus Baltobacteraceae bacterium]
MSAEGLVVSVDGVVARVRLSRPHKRNALDAATIAGLHAFFASPPAGVRVAVLTAEGDHFCAGLDLSEHVRRSPMEALESSRAWHRAFDAIELGTIPVVAVLKGAVIGGGLELAASCHVRLADRTTFFALPEGQRGIFLGGSGSVRITRLIGMDRVREMMLTGRRYGAEDGLRLGIVHELAEANEADARAQALAESVAKNSDASTFAMLQSLPRIAAMPPEHGLYAEALTTVFVQSDPAAEDRMSAFLEKRS